jgi:transcriptional regulator with XRE-family HTH domain
VDPLKKEFIELYKASGWNQAEVARQLELTRGGVNGIITGGTIPSLATVKLFRLILDIPKTRDSATGPNIEPRSGEPWVAELIHELRALDKPRRERLLPALLEFVRACSDKPAKTRR